MNTFHGYRSCKKIGKTSFFIIIRLEKLEGKIVLITGASSGIGRQAAIDFANKGAGTVILVARSESKLIELKKTLQAAQGSKRSEIVTYPCDISIKEDVLGMGTEILERFGHVDILVNNAGFGEFGKAQDQSIDLLESVMRTNYFGMVYCTYSQCSQDTQDIL